MKSWLKKYRLAWIPFVTLMGLVAVDLSIWSISFNSNSRTLLRDLNSVVIDDDVTVLGETRSCGVNKSKWARTTSCSVSNYVVVNAGVNMDQALEKYFSRLKTIKWDTNFEKFKTELLTGPIDGRNQCIRFYRDDYDPNGKLNLIEVCRVDQGLTLNDLVIHQYNDDLKDGLQKNTPLATTNVIVIKFSREQLSSLSHFIVGLFMTY